MRWLKVKTLEELQTLGSFKEVRQDVQNSLGNTLGLKAKSWQNLWESIQAIQNLISEQLGQQNQENTTTNISILDEDSLYFKSEASRIIYALVELDQKYRLKELRVNQSHYQDADKARQWRNELAKIIHPDICKHPKAALATSKLTIK
ncbi:hypothetical protein IQ227_05770 [Anabaena aphanizomenioides LEGE 00250]|uniref:Uncharacterized protein n=1 Tax=Sphaerospermopsis aphanizomenoides LEGE 00250 TaxID=2777972 RepID=A0ABR9VAR9_9CYAN|nr:hypothetical protein [Sphaerospermopsis aphanizomenoides]MBE9235558.1 hypothetical protein [Sphaerospermopsis aphanizomenoides LEGE 00250]